MAPPAALPTSQEWGPATNGKTHKGRLHLHARSFIFQSDFCVSTLTLSCCMQFKKSWRALVHAGRLRAAVPVTRQLVIVRNKWCWWDTFHDTCRVLFLKWPTPPEANGEAGSMSVTPKQTSLPLCGSQRVWSTEH